MNTYTCAILFTVIMTIQAVKDDVVLGSVSRSSSSQFGAGSTETHYVNNNGIQEKVSTTTSYQQKADGSCVRRVEEVRNGVSSVREEQVDCEKAKQDVKKQGEKTQKEISKNSEKLNKEIEREQKRIQESIAKQMRDMNRFQFW